jgi:hypothetical protein
MQAGPAWGGADADPRVVSRHPLELPDVGGVADDVPRTAPGDPVDQAGRVDGGGGRHDHGADTDLAVFSKAFTATYSVSPSRYREMNKKQTMNK